LRAKTRSSLDAVRSAIFTILCPCGILHFLKSGSKVIERNRDFATTISEMGPHAARAGIDNLERATKNFVYFVISTSRP
jgi:hypothetical protein